MKPRFSTLPLSFAAPLAALLLAACAASGPVGSRQAPRAADGPPALVVQSRVIGKDTDFVELSVRWRGAAWTATGAALVAPDGSVIAPEDEKRSENIVNDRTGPSPSGFVGIGGWPGGYYGNGVGVGFGIGFPLSVFAPPRSRTVRHYRATFRVKDASGYRRDSAGWRLRVRFTDKQGRDHLVFAPAPASGL